MAQLYICENYLARQIQLFAQKLEKDEEKILSMGPVYGKMAFAIPLSRHAWVFVQLDEILEQRVKDPQSHHHEAIDFSTYILFLCLRSNIPLGVNSSFSLFDCQISFIHRPLQCLRPYQFLARRQKSTRRNLELLECWEQVYTPQWPN
jgi:hypothetical protein